MLLPPKYYSKHSVASDTQVKFLTSVKPKESVHIFIYYLILYIYLEKNSSFHDSENSCVISAFIHIDGITLSGKKSSPLIALILSQ